MSADSDPARGLYKVTKGTPFPKGIGRALLVGTPGTANLTDADGAACANVPLQQGYNPIQVAAIAAGGTADDIWVLY